MTGGAPPSRLGGGLSLYADLLGPSKESVSTSSSISRAPVVSQEALEAVKEQEAAKKPVDPALRFQPFQSIRRPQQKSQKPKAGFPKAAAIPLPSPASAVTNNASAASTTSAGGNASNAPQPARTTLADWAATEDDEWMYGTGEKRARGGRKNRKRKKAGNNNEGDGPRVETDWDEIYDPSRPTNVEEYLRSDERIREVRDWKALLYRHRRPASPKTRSSWDSDEDREEERRPQMGQFAPPASYSFAPPPPSPPRAAAPAPNDSTGDHAYARRMAMSTGNAPPPPDDELFSSTVPPPPPPPTIPDEKQAAISHIPPPPPPPPEPDTSTISRAPVRYSQPPEQASSSASSVVPPTPTAARGPDAMVEEEGEEEVEDEEAERSNRPGQRGFAARLMSKYGWSKGQGLGAEGSGILQPLRVQVEKRKKKPDSEGGGWAGPGGRGKIIESKKNNHNNQQQELLPTATEAGGGGGGGGGSGFGRTSNVIILRGMLDGLEDVRAEMEEGLGQEIGEECGDKYGRVERLYIDIEGRAVYIKFVDQVSALRAVNALDGRVFAGNTIEPRFYDVDLFEQGVYESRLARE